MPWNGYIRPQQNVRPAHAYQEQCMSTGTSPRDLRAANPRRTPGFHGRRTPWVWQRQPIWPRNA